MPPKKVKVIPPTEKIYSFLTGDEVNAREQRYSSRIIELRACLNFVDDATNLVSQLDKAKLVADIWLDYIMCIPLPKPNKPYAIRLYLEKLKFFERLGCEQTIAWTLSVNERSLLSQNIFRKDLTSRFLRKTLKIDFGYEYGDHINNCLNVIRPIEYFLNNETDVAKYSDNVISDIMHLKTVIQNEINQFFDRYTYRILCSERAYMMSVDAITCEYCFSTDNFQIHIWCLKNVPIRFGQFEHPRLKADLHELKMTLHIPLSILKHNLSIRAIHTNFDHVSEYAKSFSQEIMPSENFHSGIQELPECLLNEWLMQMEIQSRVRNNMIEKRLDYEKQMLLYEEEQEARKKLSKANPEVKLKKSKVAKPLKEPPEVASDAYPDIWIDFIAEEQDQHLKFIDTVYNPKCLGLDEDEINLKKYFILGGIYQLVSVRKPLHYDFNSFNMTWHQDEGKLEIDKNLRIPPNYRATIKRRSTRFIMNDELESEDTDADCPWFIITIILPDYLCYWGEPIACHYETTTKKIEEQIIEKVPSFIVKKKHKGGHDPIPIPEPQVVKDPDAEYLNFLENQKGRLSLALLKALEYTKLSYDDIIYRASLPNYRVSHLQKTDAQNCPARDAEGVLNVPDFQLSEVLSKPQIRNMERYLIPRIISSFKFPKEILEDELEALKNRPKSKGGTLIRKPVTSEIPIGKNNHIFSFNRNQNNPERLYTIYPREEPMRIVEYIHDPYEKVDNPRSFAQLVSIINFIKISYKQRVYKITNLELFKTKSKLVNKRLKEQLKKEIKLKLKKNIPVSTSRTNLRKTKSLMKTKSTISTPSKHTLAKTSETNTENSLKESTSDIEERDGNRNTESQEQAVEDETNTITYSHWTTKYIMKSNFDKANCKVVIQTDRLGTIGFAFKRYEHFPFKYWKMEPSDTDPENEVIFTLETQYVACILKISGNGIRGHVTEPTKTFKRNPKMYLVIDKPIIDFREFKKICKESYLNIFAEQDANYYIENGYFSEKHLATEKHAYSCMAVHCSQMKFNFSQWNRLATRRDIILQFVQYKDLADNTVQVRLTPEEATFVEITELCSDNVDDIKLKFDLTWRNLNTYTDFHHLINSMYPSATDMRCKNPKLLTCVRDLLCAIRPLSFS